MLHSPKNGQASASLAPCSLHVTTPTKQFIKAIPVSRSLTPRRSGFAAGTRLVPYDMIHLVYLACVLPML